jgi:hypothetical protein
MGLHGVLVGDFMASATGSSVEQAGMPHERESFLSPVRRPVITT